MPADRNSISPHSVGDSMAPRSLKAKKRTPGACDYCKRKKVKCDSAVMPGNKCSNCISSGNECTHDDVLKTMKNMREYVDVLEQRLQRMDEILNKALPGLDLSTVGLDPLPAQAEDDEDTPVARNDDELNNVASRMITLHLNPKTNYFSGRSSNHQLIQTALELKDEYINVIGLPKKDSWFRKRSEFWNIPLWMTPHPDTLQDFPAYIFPENDLLASLVEAYFIHVNPYFPLLHRPTFERSLYDQEHSRDHQFGGIVLLVCALGSRYSDDTRVFVDGSNSTTSAGWKWFSQVNVLRKSYFKRTSLYELQLYALSSLYGQSTQAPDGVWIKIGIALRMAQEVGAHRKRITPNGKPNAENELWKRAFWILLCLDRLISSYSGRPCCVQEEDVDLDLPVDCDDEFWDQGFTQPLGRPTKISFFIYYLKLMDILAYGMKVIYPINRSNTMRGKALPEQKAIPDIDSAMNRWLDSIPIHLRWSTNCTDDLLLKQSATLHASYYYLQIFVHRPFIPSPRRNPRPSAFPSLAICTNAARLCCHVLQESFRKLKTPLFPALQIPAMHAATILLLNIWSGKKSGQSPNTQRDLEDVQKCMKDFKTAEKRWCSAGRYYDILNELACAGEVAISVDSPQNPGAATGYSSPNYGEGSPNNVHSPQSSDSTLFVEHSKSSCMLPVYSSELGNLPVYGQSNFNDMFFITNSDQDQNLCPQVNVAFNQEENFITQDFPMEYSGTATHGSQNLFSAADDFVRNALFGDQACLDDNLFYFPPTSLPNSVGAGIFDNGPKELENLSYFFGPTDVGNTGNNPGLGETPSAAASIFAAYDPALNQDDSNNFAEAKPNRGDRFYF